MAWWDFIKTIRQNEEDEEERAKRGGVGNRIFSFLDDTLDTTARLRGQNPDTKSVEEADRERREREEEARIEAGSDKEKTFIGLDLGEGENKTIFGKNAAWLLPSSLEKTKEVKTGREFKTTEKKYLEQFDKLDDQLKDVYLSDVQKKANDGDEKAQTTLDSLRNTGRLKGDIGDFLEGSNERLYGGLARGAARVTDLALPGKNTFGLEEFADDTERVRQVTDAGKAGETAGSIQKGVVDTAAMVLPSTKAEKFLKGTKFIKNLQDGGKVSKFGAKVLPNIVV